MNKPLEITRNEKGDNYKSVSIVYTEEWSHDAVLESFIQVLVKNKFASRKEILSVWKDLLASK